MEQPPEDLSHRAVLEGYTRGEGAVFRGSGSAADFLWLRLDSSTALKASTDSKWQHDTVNHTRGEYVRYEGNVCIRTNTVESFFKILKRGVHGVHHHWSKHHLHCYLAEFDFRYNFRETTDPERALLALMGVGGKRLMYRDSCASV